MDTIDLRNAWNLSQKDLAVALGISVRTVQGWDFKKSLPEWQYKCIQSYIREKWHLYCEAQEEGYIEENVEFAEYLK